MDPLLRSQYQRLLCEVEEPIRDIVNAIWGLEFVVDTGYSCCGHITATNTKLYIGGKNTGGYPHRATLEIAYSPEPQHLEQRDAFDQSLRAIVVGKEGNSLYFNNVRTYEDKCLPYSRIEQPNYQVIYDADINETQAITPQRIVHTEALLTQLWEAVAVVICQYNPQDKIGPIKGKSFRNVIKWAHWGRTFPKTVPNRFPQNPTSS